MAAAATGGGTASGLVDVSAAAGGDAAGVAPPTLQLTHIGRRFGYVTALASAAGNRLIALHGSDSRMRVWSVATGLCEALLADHKPTPFAVFTFPDRLHWALTVGFTLGDACSTTFVLHDVGEAVAPPPSPSSVEATPAVVAPLHVWRAHGYFWPRAMLSGGRFIAGSNDQASVWDAATGTCHSTMATATHAVRMTSVGEHMVVAALLSCDLVAWRLRGNVVEPCPTAAATLRLPSRTWSLATLPGGVVACGQADRTIVLVAVGDDGSLCPIGSLHPESAHERGDVALACLPDGSLASVWWRGAVVVWDVGMRARLGQVRCAESHTVRACVLSDGRLAFTRDQGMDVAEEPAWCRRRAAMLSWVALRAYHV